MSTLFLDIETAPNQAFVWRAWKENISTEQFIAHSEIMCIAYKWKGDNHVYVKSAFGNTEIGLLREIRDVLNKADIVVTHNGVKFDLPVIRTRLLHYGMKPFSPVRQFDTCLEAKKTFRFAHNSLEFIAKYLGVKEKNKHSNFPGFSLWKECVNGNPKAWYEMEIYNIDDVVTLEEVYNKLLPWSTTHPNEKMQEYACPKCGGSVQKRGVYRSKVGIYQRYRCNECGSWSRGRQMVIKRPKMLVNAL